MSVHFFSESIDFELPLKKNITEWIYSSARSEQHTINSINFIFCSDEYLLKINSTYLSHHYYTDIITFDNSSTLDIIEGDIFISIDRIRDNAQEYSVSFEDELCRVIIHGVLHLIGYDDKNNDAASIMREKENHYLSLRNFSL